MSLLRVSDAPPLALQRESVVAATARPWLPARLDRCGWWHLVLVSARPSCCHLPRPSPETVTLASPGLAQPRLTQWPLL